MDKATAGTIRLFRIFHTVWVTRMALLLLLIVAAPWQPTTAQTEASIFTIQIASCESKVEADVVATQLAAQQVQTEISSLDVAGRGTVYRVRVGQFKSISAARAEAERLRAAKQIQSYWIAKRESGKPSAVHSAAATAPADEIKVKAKEKVLPELSLGQFLNALSDRWGVRVPETIGVYTAALIAPKTRSIRTAVVLMDEARIRQFTLPFVKRPDLLNPFEMRFEPGVKNSPANTGMKFAQAEKLTQSLRQISGYQDLAFDERGYLILGKRISGGADLARMLLRTAVESNEIFEIESIEGSDAIAFGAFISTEFNNKEKGLVAFNRIQLDFKDFGELRGEQRLLDAFDPAFVFLHEIAHGVWELPDEGRGGLGECEAFINQIRRQLGLPERLRYHYQVRGQANGGELGEMIFIEQDSNGRHRPLKLLWDNRAVNSNTEPSKGSPIAPQ